MKKLLTTLILLASIASCQKTDFVEYRVTGITKKNSFACEYALYAGQGKPTIYIQDECGKYKINQVVFKMED
jgi:hypothetical protein